jgi:hypothetical protein
MQCGKYWETLQLELGDVCPQPARTIYRPGSKQRMLILGGHEFEQASNSLDFNFGQVGP